VHLVDDGSGEFCREYARKECVLMWTDHVLVISTFKWIIQSFRIRLRVAELIADIKDGTGSSLTLHIDVILVP